jgi:pyruvate ferredoxin oxidoreductase gamma subunit
MYEIRIHGRGGQGVKTTARILGRAAFLAGYEIQDFAIYGAERRGAPVASFCRMDKTRILTRGYIFNPDAVIVLDPTISRDVVLGGTKKETLLVVNSERPVSKFMGALFVDATKIALDTLGRPIPNVAILGCFLKKARLFPLDKLKEAVRAELEEAGHPEHVKGNIEACERCWSEVRRESR